MTSLNPNNSSLWRTTKNIIQRKEIVPPIHCPENSLEISDKEKAVIFGNHLVNIFQPHTDINPNTEQLDSISSSIDSPLPKSLPIKPITSAEIKNQINKLPANRAPGYDLITNKILKQLSHKSILFLIIIHNAMLRLSYFPPI